jgi:hypothetical protein
LGEKTRVDFAKVSISAHAVVGISGRAGTDSAGQPLTPAQAGTVHVNVNCPSGES